MTSNQRAKEEFCRKNITKAGRVKKTTSLFDYGSHHHRIKRTEK